MGGVSSHPLMVAFQGSLRDFEHGSDISSWQLAISSFLVSLFPHTFHCQEYNGVSGLDSPRLPKRLKVKLVFDEASECDFPSKFSRHWTGGGRMEMEEWPYKCLDELPCGIHSVGGL